MPVQVAINGFGRIGRVALRVALTKYLDKVRVVAINTSGSMDVAGWAHLFEYDSVYGRFRGKLKARAAGKASGDARQNSTPGGGQAKLKTEKEIGILEINNQIISVLAEREPAKIPWKGYDTEVVVESTGVFCDRQSASAHLKAGAKKVLISAPSKDAKTYLLGVNEDQYRGELVINMGSCTTNCVAPVTKVMMDNFGLQKAQMITVHANTADQQLVDGSHRDLRRARAAGINIVPTSTGAAVATTQVLPSLQGLFDGLAYRVPIICGSVIDCSFITTKRTTVEAVNEAFQKAAAGKFKGIIAVSDKPLVSTDIIGNSASAIVDLALTQVIDGDLIKVVAWYDNEWGYCCRLIEMAEKISNKS